MWRAMVAKLLTRGFSGLRDPRNGKNEVLKRFPTHLEVRVLVEGGAGGGQQNDRLGSLGGLGIAGRSVDRKRKHLIDLVWDLAVERLRKVVCRLADQVSLADARKEFGERS